MRIGTNMRYLLSPASCIVVLGLILVWCADLSASNDTQRPYVPPSETPAALLSTLEDAAREVLIAVAPGIMDFPEGKTVAQWHEFENVHPALRNALDRHAPEILFRAFHDFDPETDTLRLPTGQSDLPVDPDRIYKVRFPPGADRAAISEYVRDLAGVLFAEPNQPDSTDPGPAADVAASDFDGDGEVDFADFLAFAAGFGNSSDDDEFDAKLDLDGDDIIGFGDFLTFARSFGKPVPSTTGGVCDRTLQVRDAIVRVLSGVDDCALVTSEHLASIQSLSLFGQGIVALQDADFSGLSNLKGLELSNNKLTTLPERVFAGLDSLQVLELRQNDLISLPLDVFSRLFNLKGLALSGNDLGRLPRLRPARSGWRGNLPPPSRLERLELHDIGLTSLYNSELTGLYKLRSLNLSGNDFSTLSKFAFWGRGGTLKRLDLRGNNLRELPERIFLGQRLEVLRLDDNPGAPFTLTLELKRTDYPDTATAGKATIVVTLAEGAPFLMNVNLSAQEGTLTTTTLKFGHAVSKHIVATRRGTEPVTVRFGPTPELPVGLNGRARYSGIRIATGPPLDLSEPSPNPYHRLYRIQVDSVAYASRLSSFTFQGSEIRHFRPVPTTSPLAVTDTMRVLFYGGIGPDGCYDFSHFDTTRVDSGYRVRVWGIEDTSPDIACIMAIMELHGWPPLEFYPPLRLGTWIFLVSQPDDSVLRKEVVVQ